MLVTLLISKLMQTSTWIHGAIQFIALLDVVFSENELKITHVALAVYLVITGPSSVWRKLKKTLSLLYHEI